MSWRSKVIWSQGMFLQPHHFQQEARHQAHLVDARARSAGAHDWGYSELVIDEGQLALGRVAILRAVGVLPDGTPFAIPAIDAAPAAFEVPADMQGEAVVLAAPVERDGVDELDFGEAGAPLDLARWRVANREVRDHGSAADEPETVQVGLLNLRLMRARDAGEAFSALGVVRVVERRADRQVLLDRATIVPQTRLEASGQLSATASLLHGLIRQCAGLLAARMGQGSHGVSEVAEFMMLQALNRADPLFRQLAGVPSAHPRELYLACVQLAGELATFAGEERQAAEYPLYRHDDLGATFTRVIEDLRRLLAYVPERHAQQIELSDRGFGVYIGVIPDRELTRSAAFVLAVNAQLPAEQLRQRFLGQAKLGPADRIKDLVNMQLPGITMRLLPVAPRQVPFHAGCHYFEFDKAGDLWRQLERNGNLALHVPGEFPGLELELWAIRR